MLFHGICERAGSVDSSNGNIKTVHTNCFVQRLITSALRNHTSVSVVLYRKQPAIPFHEASVQRILRVWMRSAKIY